MRPWLLFAPPDAIRRGEAQRELKSVPDLSHACLRQGRDQRADPAPGDRLQVIEVHGALAGHALIPPQHDFGRDVANHGSHRRNGRFPKEFKRGVARQDKYRAALVRRIKPVPANLIAPHRSPQACSSSQTENSCSPTGRPR